MLEVRGKKNFDEPENLWKVEREMVSRLRFRSTICTLSARVVSQAGRVIRGLPRSNTRATGWKERKKGNKRRWRATASPLSSLATVNLKLRHWNFQANLDKKHVFFCSPRLLRKLEIRSRLTTARITKLKLRKPSAQFERKSRAEQSEFHRGVSLGIFPSPSLFTFLIASRELRNSSPPFDSLGSPPFSSFFHFLFFFSPSPEETY